MMLLNTTFAVDANIARDFIRFIDKEFLPVAASEGLYSALLCNIRTATEKNLLTGQPTLCYALQMRAPSPEHADKFKTDRLPELYTEISRRWPSAVAFFETTMDVVVERHLR